MREADEGRKDEGEGQPVKVVIENEGGNLNRVYLYRVPVNLFRKVRILAAAKGQTIRAFFIEATLTAVNRMDSAHGGGIELDAIIKDADEQE